MDSENNILLEEYFNTATSEKRRSEIREELLKLNPNDPDRILFELGEEVSVEEKVQKLSANIESISNNRSGNWPLKIAASIVFILASVFIVLELNKSNASSNDLFNTYFLPYDGVVISRDDSEGLKGMQLYNTKAYKEAIYIFENEFKVTGNPEVALLISSSYLSIDNPEEALNWLNQISDNANRKLINNRDWYKALALIKMDRTAQGKEILEKIIEAKSPYREKATQLLSDLDEP